MRSFSFLLVLFLSSAADAWQENFKDIVIRADLSSDRSEQKELAEKVLKGADECLQEDPKAVVCYYYRGQARGLYYGNSPFGYAKRLRLMLADWQKAMDLDPAFDYGGPWRMLAEVYIALPKYLGPKGLRQDLNKAIQLLEKAVQISDYPTNYLDLSEAHLKAGNFEAAQKAIQKAKNSLPKWRQNPYFQSWQATMKELEAKM